MFNKTKSAVIFSMIILIIVIVGFVFLFTRKQTIVAGELKSSWGKTKTTEPATEA